MTPKAAPSLVVLVLVLVACGGDSPSEPRTDGQFAVLSHNLPSALSRGELVVFEVAVDPLEAAGSWEEGGLTVSLPGVFDHDSARVVTTNADSEIKTPSALHGGGFDFVLRRGDFRVGRGIRASIELRVRPQAVLGTASGNIDAVAFDDGGAGGLLELGLLPLRVQVR